MKRVYVCSSLSGDINGNIEKAKLYASYVIRKCGAAPVVPHFYAFILDDKNPDERKLGMSAGLSLLWMCDEVWVFGDCITSGMSDEIKFAKSLNIRIRYVSDKEIFI